MIFFFIKMNLIIHFVFFSTFVCFFEIETIHSYRYVCLLSQSLFFVFVEMNFNLPSLCCIITFDEIDKSTYIYFSNVETQQQQQRVYKRPLSPLLLFPLFVPVLSSYLSLSPHLGFPHLFNAWPALFFVSRATSPDSSSLRCKTISHFFIPAGSPSLYWKQA